MPTPGPCECADALATPNVSVDCSDACALRLAASIWDQCILTKLDSLLRTHHGRLEHDLKEWMSRQDGIAKQFTTRQTRLEGLIEAYLLPPIVARSALDAASAPVGTEAPMREMLPVLLGGVDGLAGSKPRAPKAPEIPETMEDEGLFETALAPKWPCLGLDNAGLEESPDPTEQLVKVATPPTPAAGDEGATVAADLSEVPTKRADRPRTNELIMRDVRNHWRKMIRKTRASRVRFEPVMQVSRIGSQKQFSNWQNFVKSRHYEICVMAVVILNTSFIGWQVQHHAVHEAPPASQSAIEFVFCMVFLTEILVRWWPEGRYFFSSADWGWNLFDSVVVFMMLAEEALQVAMEHSASFLSKLSMVRILRVVRIVRVIRVIRVLKFFRELRMMIHQILGSLKSLLWAMLVLVMMFYVFGIALTQGAIDHFENIGTWSGAEARLLRVFFGSLDRSVLSLFEAMAGGISWGELLDALQPLHFSYSALFLVFISFSIFAVVNIVTGVFVDSALQTAQQDRESIIQEEMQSKESYMKSMQHVFEEMDANGNGFISLSEFEAAIEDERMVAYFNALGLDITDVQTLFCLLDRDQEGSIDIEEFLLGCMRLKGEARSLDLAKLLYESDYVVHNLENLVGAVKELSDMVALHTPQNAPSSLSVLPSVGIRTVSYVG